MVIAVPCNQDDSLGSELNPLRRPKFDPVQGDVNRQTLGQRAANVENVQTVRAGTTITFLSS